MRSFLRFRRLPLVVLITGGLAACGDHSGTKRSDGQPTAEPKNAAVAAPPQVAPDAQGASAAAGLKPVAASGNAPVLLPEGKPTGRLPEEWKGRSAQAEEQRLRQAGEWETARTVFFELWGKADPVAAIAASRTTDPGAITISTSSAVSGWAAADLKTAMAWVERQPANAEHAAFVAAVLGVAKPGGEGGVAFDEMADWLGGQANLPSIRPTVDGFVREWSQSNRDAAVNWTIARVRDESARTSIFSDLMQHSVGDGSDGFAKTGEWLTAMPAGNGKDELLVAFVRAAAVHDPGASAKWAALIEDGILRQRAEKISRDAALGR